MNCFHCGADTSNGLALCERCRVATVVNLEFIPTYFRNLARWKPGRAGGRPVPGSRVLYDGTVRGLGTGDKISDTLDEVVNELTTWARLFADDRGDHLPRPLTLLDAVLIGDLSDETADALSDDEPLKAALLCQAFDKHLTSLSLLEWVGEFAADLGVHETRLRRLTERYVPGWYAGACRQCQHATYVVPGLTWVTCAFCGTSTHASMNLDNILTEARGWVAPPLRVAEVLVALVDTEMSVTRLHKRISKWGERETGRCIVAYRKVDADGDEVGPKRFRLGDVLDLLEAEGATRLTPSVPMAKVS